MGKGKRKKAFLFYLPVQRCCSKIKEHRNERGEKRGKLEYGCHLAGHSGHLPCH